MPGLLDSRRWDVLPQRPEVERLIAGECGLPGIVARTLAARGFSSVAEVEHFLTPSLARDWADPLVIPGMDEAAGRVGRAIDAGETIAVFGDFDVDGITATCLLTLGLRELGAHAMPYIPHRFGEGYGLSETALRRVIDDCSPGLVVTVDNGIAAKNEVAWLSEQGVDTVITDHHEPSDLVPEGVPVTDPKIGPGNPSRELAGAGVALKLVQELGRRRGMPTLWERYIEVATLGTISDMMELDSENRALVAEGIARMRQTRRPGILALATISGIDLAHITADELPFSLIPRLNAAGRMGTTEVALQLLLTEDPARALDLAQQLERVNDERRETESRLTEEAMAKVEATYRGGRVIVVGGEGWHEGVKGIVASRITNRYHVPTILFSISNGIARGSGRSVGTVDLFHAVEQCSDMLVRFGGHAGAVGVTCEESRLPAFAQALEQVLDALPEESFEDRGEVAALAGLSEMTCQNIDALNVMQPFGQGNKKPLFGVLGVTMKNRAKVGGKGNHLRFVATDGRSSVQAIIFRAPDIDRAMACDEVVDLVFEPVSETWQGRTKPKLMVKDIVYRDLGPAADRAPGPADALMERADAAPSGTAPADGPLSLDVRDGERQRLAELPDGALVEQLRQALLGASTLLPAQERALDLLDQGRSTLCIMATGRGKSLVFHLHAARLAIRGRGASVFVYPLRALCNDQFHHLSDELAPLGIRVALLTGETDPAGRERVFSALDGGGLDIILTTPEFLDIHVRRFAASGRVRFVVLDEAHHMGPGLVGTRSAYARLPKVLATLGRPTCLATTATAADDVAREICRLLSIAPDDVVVDGAVRDNLHVRDLRELRERDATLANVVARGEKTVIYVNSRDTAVSLARMLRHAVPDLAPRIGFYHAGLSRKDRVLVESAFRDGRLCCIVSTSAFGEGVNIPDIRNVMLYHLPFGATEFNQMSGRAGRDGRDAWIWLLFGGRDARVNERLLATTAPARGELVTIYRTLRRLASSSASQGLDRAITLQDGEIALEAQKIDPTSQLDERAVAHALLVFSELGFLSEAGDESSRRISLASSPRKMELTQSICYLEGLRAREAFPRFRDWVLRAGSDELLWRINRPIVPTFGRRARG